LAHVIQHIFIFMEVDMERVGLILNISRYTILHLFHFRLIRPEHPVPDNKSSPVVLINILLLATMMYTVIRRRGENIFDPSRALPDIFGMNPELEQDRYLVGDKKYNGMKTH